MIFTIFVYIVGVLLILKGFRLSYNTGTLRTRMSHPQMLVITTNRIIGLAYAASWASIRMIPDQKEALMMGSSIMSFAHKGAEEAMAYNYVVNQTKH